MHEPTADGALSRATADVLEKMFFTDTVESDAIAESGTEIVVRLTFDGERRGELLLGASPDAARMLAANFLGTEPEEPDEGQVRAVVCELANMVCGDTLSALEEGALRLSTPKVLPSAAWSLPPGASSRCFDLGDGILRIALAFWDACHG